MAKNFEVEALYIDMNYDCTTPYDSEYFTIEADDEFEALRKARELAYESSLGSVAESLSVEVQL